MDDMLKNKTAIVTGANSGMGMATVRALSDMGAKVIMLCRSEKRGTQALEKLLTEDSSRDLELILCDLGNYDSIRAFANIVRRSHDHIDIMVNNAGFISLDRQETKEGLERQFGINHIGHFLLTMSLIDLMGEGGRIVNVASGAHKTGKIHFDDINLHKGFNVIKAYSQSKLANDQALVVVIGIVLINSALYITSNLIILFFKYDLGPASGSDWVGSYTLFSTVGGAF